MRDRTSASPAGSAAVDVDPPSPDESAVVNMSSDTEAPSGSSPPPSSSPLNDSRQATRIVEKQAEKSKPNIGSKRLVEEDESEAAHFRRIINAFRYYRTHSMKKLNRTEAYMKSLPKQHQVVLSKYGHHLDSVRMAIEHNYEIIKLIVADASHMFENVEQSATSPGNSSSGVNLMDTEKVQSTLRQFVRDWSEEGAAERKACYQPILDEIERLFPSHTCDVKSINILVPGSGLGRLAHEIARRGYTCQGNEFSLFMLIAANFVLNKCHGLNLYRLYPWVHHYSNNLQSQDQVRYILFPDVNPSHLPAGADFSMAAGDFLQVYKENDAWDCVATCFFLDTAKNIVEYIETLWRILKPGGYWINLGPLLYHFADMPNEDSIEPSAEDVLEIIKKFGFDLQGEVYDMTTTYVQNPFSMLRYEYKSIFFVFRKPLQQSTPR